MSERHATLFIWFFPVFTQTGVRCLCGTRMNLCRGQSSSKVCRGLTGFCVCCQTRLMLRFWMLQVLLLVCLGPKDQYLFEYLITLDRDNYWILFCYFFRFVVMGQYCGHFWLIGRHIQNQHVMERPCVFFYQKKEAAGAVICLIFLRLFASR